MTAVRWPRSAPDSTARSRRNGLRSTLLSQQLAATMLAYLAQVTVSIRPSHGPATEADLRIFAGFLIDHDPALELCRRHRTVPHRSVQALATRPTRPDRQAVQGDVVPAADVAAADVLHPHHRMGLGRRPAQGPDLLR